MGDTRADAARIAEAVRAACIEAALEAYEDAGLSGLCVEGRWECAIEAMRGLDLAPYLAALPATPSRSPMEERVTPRSPEGTSAAAG